MEKESVKTMSGAFGSAKLDNLFDELLSKHNLVYG